MTRISPAAPLDTDTVHNGGPLQKEFVGGLEFVGGCIFGAIVAGLTVNTLNFSDPAPPLNIQDARSVLRQMKFHGVEAHVTIYGDQTVYIWLEDLKNYGKSTSLEGALAALHDQGIALATATELKP